MEELQSWLTIDEFSLAIGKSRRAVERLISLHQVAVAKRPVEGKKPITVLNPAEIERHKAILLRPTVAQLPATLATHPRQPADLLAVLAVVEKLRVPLAQQLLLSIREAALYMGVPQAEIQRLIQAKRLPTVQLMNGRLKIARTAVEHYAMSIRPVADLAESQKKISRRA